MTFTVPFLKPGTTSRLYNRWTGLGLGRAGIERVAELWFRARLEGLGVEKRPVVLASNIYCPGLLSRLPRKLLLYDFNDSPFQFASAPPWAADYWRRTRAQVDAFFVVSEYYRRELESETDRPLMVIGNGVEMSHFEPLRPVPSDLERCPRPLIGYVGLLSHFLDFEVLEALRQARRGGTLVLVGPGIPETEHRVRELAAKDGVVVLGPKPYVEVPAYMQALDVGVIPFRANDRFVQGINPNKVYQYLAAGVPVVTTPVLDLTPQFPHLVFAAGPAEMRAGVERVLDQSGDREARRQLARPHDWSILAARLVAEIERLARAS